MTDPQPDTVRHSRRFVIRHPSEPDMHGVQFPSGRVIADDPNSGLIAATSVEHAKWDDRCTIHFADEDTDTPGATE